MSDAAAPVRGIGFDYTGVVARLPEGDFFEQVANLAGTDSQAVRNVYYSYNHDFQVGELSQEQLWRQVADDLQVQDRFQALWDTARARLPRIDHQMLGFVDQLRAAGYRTGLLSNLAPDTPWHHQLYREGVQTHFDVVCLSGETGLAKPDPAAFMDLAGKMGIKPAELIFIDDRPQAIKGVEALGVRTVAFDGINPLKKALTTMGIHWSHQH